MRFSATRLFSTSTLESRIHNDMIDAMRKKVGKILFLPSFPHSFKDDLRVNVLRRVKSKITYAQKEASNVNVPKDDNFVQNILHKQNAEADQTITELQVKLRNEQT